MPKASKKSKEHPTSEDESFTLSSNPKRVKRCHQLTTTNDGKKNRRSTSKSTKKVKKTTMKSKKTLPRTTKGNLFEETTPPTKMTRKGKGKRFDQHQDPMEKMSTGTVTEPDLSSTTDSSSVSTTNDQESQ